MRKIRLFKILLNSIMTKLTRIELLEEVKALNLGIKNIQKLKKDELLQILSDHPVILTEQEVQKSDIPILYPITSLKK